jgi:arginine utilization protein RocB
MKNSEMSSNICAKSVIASEAKQSNSTLRSSSCAKSQDPVLDLPSHLQKYAKNILGRPYDTEHFYTGISDLSYAGYSKENWSESESILKKIMPLYGSTYNIPFEELSEIAMPVINIGPWGKDFHKLTERVLKKDVQTETPRLILEALRHLEII